jgi:sensor c-di-GMP phosphodiesterase-like protein
MKKNFSRTLFFLAATSLIFLLSGCKANMITKLNADGSGTFAQEIGFTAEEISSLSSMGTEGSICTSTESEMTNMPANAVRREEKRGEETWCIYESPFGSLEELKSIYGSTDVLVNDISLVNGKIHYDITLDMSGDSGTSLSVIQMKWIVEMPGTVSNHNADEVSGSTLTWNLVAGPNLNMYADSSTGGNMTWWIIAGIGALCLCLVVIILVVAVVFFVSRNKKKAQGS